MFTHHGTLVVDLHSSSLFAVNNTQCTRIHITQATLK